MRSKTLPWPPVILAMMSLPQRTSQVTPPMRSRTIINIMVVIILRAFDTGFFAFFGFLDFLVGLSFWSSLSLSLLVLLARGVASSDRKVSLAEGSDDFELTGASEGLGVSEAWSSPLCSSKLKT